MLLSSANIDLIEWSTLLCFCIHLTLIRTEEFTIGLQDDETLDIVKENGTKNFLRGNQFQLDFEILFALNP